MNLTILISSISLLVAIAAFVLNFINLRRQKTLDNENHFFKYKIEQYQQIIFKADELLNSYADKAEQAADILNDRKPDLEAVDDIADEIDEKTELFRRSLNKYSLFIPNNISNSLEDFFDTLYEAIQKDDEFEKIDKILETFEGKLDKIINLMREDIGIEVLNHKLTKRIINK